MFYYLKFIIVKNLCFGNHGLIMKTLSFVAFSLVAILLATISIVSLSTSLQNSFAQSSNNNATMAGMNMTNNNSTMMMTGDNQSMAIGKDYHSYDMGQKHEKINGTINMMSTMYQSLGSKFNVSLTQAISTAEQTIGNGSEAMSANGEEKDGFLVYSIVLGTPDMKFYNVIVDPGNGQVLASNEISMMEWMMTMHSAGQHQDKDMMMGMHQGYDKQGMMMDYQNQW
jgi:uncharacterized membrane protein YkoI